MWPVGLEARSGALQPTRQNDGARALVTEQSGVEGAQHLREMLTYADQIGVYSEEIALTGEQIGNFPNPQRQMCDYALTAR
jgi:hypothetical protein